MAYTAVKTMTNEPTLYSDWNTYVRDNMSAIWVGTTAGDLDYYTSATAKTRLAIGSTGQVLGVSGGVPAWVGGGIEVLDHVTADTTTASNTSENTLWTYTLAANKLGTTGGLYVHAFFYWGSAVDETRNMKFYFGATPITILTHTGGAYGNISGELYCALIAKGATNSQRLAGRTFKTTTIGNQVAFGTAAIDSTAEQTVKLTVQSSASNPVTVYNTLVTFSAAV